MSSSPVTPFPKTYKAARVALLYLVFASLWIFVSDRFLTLALADPELLVRISTAKGFAFVVVTAFLLYLLLQVWDDARAEGVSASFRAPRMRQLASVFVGLALIVPLVGFSIVRLHGSHVREAAFADLRAIAALKAGQIENWLNERQSDAEVLSGAAGLEEQAQRLISRGDAGSRNYVLNRLKIFAKAWDFDAALLDATGHVVATTMENGVVSAQVWQQLLPAALSSRQVQRSDLYRDTAGRLHLDYVIPLLGFDANRQPQAAVLLHAPVERFLFPLIQTWPTPSPSAETLLVRRDGDHVLFLNELRHRSNTALILRLPLDNPNIPAVAAITSGTAQEVEGVDYRGVAVFAVTRPVAGTPWHLVAKIDRDEVMAPLKLLVFWVSLVALVAVAAVAAVTLLLWRQILRAHRLELAAQAATIQQESEARYRLLFENMLEGFAYCRMIFDQGHAQDFVYLDVNAAFERLTGLKDVTGKHVSEVIPGIRESDPELFEIYGKVAMGGKPARFETYVEALKTWFSIAVYSPAPEHFIAIFDVITARKLAEAEIRELNACLENKVEERTAQLKAINQELETFTYSVSHDLKAPLRGIDGYSRLLQEDHGAGLNAEGQAFIANIRQGAQQMGQLIEDLLAYSRLERRILQSDRIAPRGVAEAVVAEFAEAISGRRAEVRVDIPSLEVCADIDGLAMILRNLLDNALKFSRDTPQPTIEIGGREEAETCILWVRDNGIGFDMKFQERIFEIFQRLQRAEDYPGTGIGLAIVRKAVQRMGGRVWAESLPGAGAAFYLELPK